MMIGSYPCCDGDLWRPMPDITPSYEPAKCPHCGAKVWHCYSRIDPKTYLEADFLALFDVDPVARKITPRHPVTH